MSARNRNQREFRALHTMEESDAESSFSRISYDNAESSRETDEACLDSDKYDFDSHLQSGERNTHPIYFGF